MHVFGGTHLSETFLKGDLFDEYRIGIAPVIPGSGRPLFRQGTGAHRLALVSSQQLESGGVVLRYTNRAGG